jgi:hypothetical protein
MTCDTQPGNASAPQNQLQRCSWGIQTGVRNGKLYGAVVPCVKRGSPSGVESENPFQQVHCADDKAANDKQQQNDAGEYCQLELSITLLVWRR